MICCLFMVYWCCLRWVLGFDLVLYSAIGWVLAVCWFGCLVMISVCGFGWLCWATRLLFSLWLISLLGVGLWLGLAL